MLPFLTQTSFLGSIHLFEHVLSSETGIANLVVQRYWSFYWWLKWRLAVMLNESHLPSFTLHNLLGAPHKKHQGHM